MTKKEKQKLIKLLERHYSRQEYPTNHEDSQDKAFTKAIEIVKNFKFNKIKKYPCGYASPCSTVKNLGYCPVRKKSKKI